MRSMIIIALAESSNVILSIEMLSEKNVLCSLQEGLPDYAASETNGEADLFTRSYFPSSTSDWSKYASVIIHLAFCRRDRKKDAHIKLHLTECGAPGTAAERCL